MESAAPVFAALGDETQTRFVTRLCEEGPQSITRLTSGQDLTRQAITKHLHVLANAGLVVGVREGREQIWELRPEHLEVPRRYVDLVSKQWDEALERLRLSVED